MPIIRLPVTPDLFAKTDKASIIETPTDGLNSGAKPYRIDDRTQQTSPTSKYKENMSCVF